MKRASSATVSIVLLLCATAANAASPTYAVIDLGVQLGGEGLPWQGHIGTPPPPTYPQLPGATGTLYSSNNTFAVGSSIFPDFGDTHATRWDSVNSTVTVIDLGVLGSGAQGPPISVAYGVNLHGEVVGYSTTSHVINPASLQTATRGFLWSNGTMTDLGSIAGVFYSSSAEGINDSHEIVGWTNTISSVTGETLQRAFIYSGGTMYNLTFYLVGGPTVLLSDAVAIDCQGNIAALGVPAGGSNMHSYLLVRQGQARTCPE